MGVLGDVVDDGADGGEFFGVFVAYFYVEFLLEGHEGFEYVEGVESEIVAKGGGVYEFGFFYAQFLVNDGLYFCGDLIVLA